VHFAKKTNNQRKTVTYLGRYLKRPPISNSRLQHYSKGEYITFNYLNHRTQMTESLTLQQEALITRIIEHIPNKHFKMIRYFGFLSQRTRGEMLPKVYDALGLEMEKKPKTPAYATLLKQYINVDPFECVLCQSRMGYDSYRVGYTLKEQISATLLNGKRRLNLR